MIRRPPRESHDGERRILVGVGYEHGAVGDEKVRHVPGLTPLIRDRSLGVRSHHGAADLDVRAARERELAGALLAVEPPGNIHLIPVGGVLVEGRQALEQWYLSARAAADRIHEVTSHSPGRVSESIRKLRAL